MALPSGAAAVVTGGGGGLGRALATELGRRGMRAVVSDIDGDAAEATAALVRDAGGEAWSTVTDVASREAVMALAEQARAWVGDVDLVCNNAGVAVSGPFEEISHDDWRWIVDINLWGVVYGCEAFVPAMKARRRGWVLNVASAAGLLSAPKMAPYNVTKAGVVALSETLYSELLPWDVQVSVLCPTFFQTQIMASGRGPADRRQQAAVAGLMKKSKVQAPDVARAALDGLNAGTLYVLPMTDARAGWRFKRFAPQRFARFLSKKLAGRPRSG